MPALRSSLFSRLVRRHTAWLFPLCGLLSLIWFLFRVIPKPSRATYPCQRAAFPLASGFVLWVVGLGASLFCWRRAGQYLRSARYLAAGAGFALALLLGGYSLLGSPSVPAQAAVDPFVPGEGANHPMGQPRGIHPGRVVWVHDPQATAWEGTGYWWEEGNTDQAVVSRMVSQGLRALTGAADDGAAWKALFVHFNAQHGKGQVGYQAGERLAIKVNLNQVSSGQRAGNSSFNTPQVVLAMVRQLVEEAGISDSLITFYDATRSFPDALVDPVHAAYPGVRFVGWEGGKAGRAKYTRDTATQIHWSQPLTLEKGGGNPTYLPTCVTEADYLINMACMRGHGLAGVTMCAKNHFGSLSADRDGQPYQWAPKAAGVHPYAAVHDHSLGDPEWGFHQRDMGTYNALVDLMGHRELGEKTVLFMMDNLYASADQNSALKLGDRWQSAPFDNDWPSNLFFSQDGIAIESVGLDFLRSEPSVKTVYGNVDNYLHEAARADAPPSGVVYDPEGDGIALSSLGVHEHWDNAADKRYSGNLGLAGGIELVTPQILTAVEEEYGQGTLPLQLELASYPNPFNASTHFSFVLPGEGPTELRICDALGRQVVLLSRGRLAAGRHAVVWEGLDSRGQPVGSGVYFARLSAGNRAITHKVLLVR